MFDCDVRGPAVAQPGGRIARAAPGGLKFVAGAAVSRGEARYSPRDDSIESRSSALTPRPPSPGFAGEGEHPGDGAGLDDAGCLEQVLDEALAAVVFAPGDVVEGHEAPGDEGVAAEEDGPRGSGGAFGEATKEVIFDGLAVEKITLEAILT